MASIVAGLAVMVAVGGCVSKTATQPEAPRAEERKMVVGKSGYQEVYQTGSNLPVRVPTSPTARPLPSASAVTTLSPEALHELIRRGQVR